MNPTRRVGDRGQGDRLLWQKREGARRKAAAAATRKVASPRAMVRRPITGRLKVGATVAVTAAIAAAAAARLELEIKAQEVHLMLIAGSRERRRSSAATYVQGQGSVENGSLLLAEGVSRVSTRGSLSLGITPGGTTPALSTSVTPTVQPHPPPVPASTPAIGSASAAVSMESLPPHVSSPADTTAATADDTRAEVDACLRELFASAKPPDAEGLTYDAYVKVLKDYGACEGLPDAEDVLATTRPPVGRLITWKDFTICLKIVALRKFPRHDMDEAVERVVVDLVGTYIVAQRAAEEEAAQAREAVAARLRREEAIARGVDPEVGTEGTEEAEDGAAGARWSVALNPTASPEEVIGMHPTRPRTPQHRHPPHTLDPSAKLLPAFVNGIGGHAAFDVIDDGIDVGALFGDGVDPGHDGGGILAPASPTVRNRRIQSPPRPHASTIEPTSQLYACTTPVSLRSEPSKVARGSARDGSTTAAWSEARSHPSVPARHRHAAEVRTAAQLLDAARARCTAAGGDGWVPPEMVTLYRAYLAYCGCALEGGSPLIAPRAASPALAPDGEPLPAPQHTQQHLFCSFAETTFLEGRRAPTYDALQDIYVARLPGAASQTTSLQQQSAATPSTVTGGSCATGGGGVGPPLPPPADLHPLDFPSFVACVVDVGRAMFPASPVAVAEQLVLQLGLNAVGCPLGLNAEVAVDEGIAAAGAGSPSRRV